jgi:hypothetical protein
LNKFAQLHGLTPDHSYKNNLQRPLSGPLFTWVSAGSIDYQKQFFKQAAASVKLGFLSIADTDRHLRNLLKGRNRF